MSELPPTPAYCEDDESQLPALLLLLAMGWRYLTPSEALAARGGRRSRVILTEVLADWVRTHNRVRYKDHDAPFMEGNVVAAVQALADIPFDGLVHTSELFYDRLRLGVTAPQTVAGATKSFPIRYVDWREPANNVFHATAEYEVEREGSEATRRPDIVCFVNGIPFAVIECKRTGLEEDPLGEATSQHIRNQREGEIPRLYSAASLLLAITRTEARYATTGTACPFWSAWRERELPEAELAVLVNRMPAPAEASHLFAGRFAYLGDGFAELARDGREVTAQDRLLWALCSPARLIELAARFVVFDGADKKIARYQQFFCVRRMLARVGERDTAGRRKGGVVWHTQGSGKSLTMVMFANALAQELAATQGADAPFRIVLVTDRVDLDEQLSDTFHRCGLEPARARTGKHLLGLLAGDRHQVVTTVIDKFEAAVGAKGERLESPDIFVLVDESHRTQYGALHARMRRVLPNACFIGFTGTPLMRAEKSTMARFGGLIDEYPITQAVADRAVVPLLYEGRHVGQAVDHAQVDRWFERITAPLSPEQRADLRRKFSRTSQLNRAEQRVAAIAWDVSSHFATADYTAGMKGMLVAPDKATALRYKHHLDEAGLVSSEVLVSAPDDREGDVDVLEDNVDAVVAFWRRMMQRYGTETAYNRQVTSAFKHDAHPQILVVVNKLLTGFDEPRVVVLYLARSLREQSLLQAIARANRVHEHKDHGYVIDYCGVLENLDAALDLYGSFPEFDADDLTGTVVDVAAEVAQLAQRHADVWDVFKEVANQRDPEALERLLGDEARRAEFYERVAAFARTLGMALASVAFLEGTPEARVAKYRADLRAFIALRNSARRRYADTVDFAEYEPRIRRLLDQHVSAGDIETLTPLVNVFDTEAFKQEVERLGEPGAKADTIAHRLRRAISERMATDPAFFEKFSKLLEDAIAQFRAERLSDADYLRRVTEVSDRIRTHGGDDLPEPVRYDPDARAIYGVVREILQPRATEGVDVDTLGAESARGINDIIDQRVIVSWQSNEDVQNDMKTAIEDYLFDYGAGRGVRFSYDEIDQILDRSLTIARARKTS